MMETWGGSVVGSPSTDTNAGRTILEAEPRLDRLARHRHLRGRRGRRDARGHEVRARLGAEPRADAPDGDRAGGAEAARPGRRLPRRRRSAAPAAARTSPASRSRSWPTRPPARTLRIVAAEPASCPSLTRGHYGYDFGDTAQLTPLLPMHTLGHTFMPAPIHAGGLRYHGMAPLVSKLVHEGSSRPSPTRQNECFAAGVRFARGRGHHPGARGQPRDPRGRGRGRGGPRGGREPHDPLQPLRARPPRARRLPAVPGRRARRPRAAAGASSTRPPRCSWGCPRPGSRQVRRAAGSRRR